ncbi:MAG: AraC family transcriptional regulator [Leptolyngbyaceae cyanobacterium MO_188.B28]|nr:AraC family transcriptional regulator [Leptolyngbyaceae cyanobacterium MO_188.B28]
MHENRKIWLVPEFDNLELFRAEAIRCHYAHHSHPGYSIGVIEAGVGATSYQGTNYLAPPKSVILMNPEEAHRCYSAEDKPLTYRMLYPSIDCIQQIANEAQIGGSPFFKDAVVQDDVLARNIRSLHIALEQSQDCLEKQIFLTEVLSEILRRHADINGQPIRSNKEHQAVHLIKEYLHDNFRFNISLEQLVDLTNLNRSYLIRVFRQAVGMPPYAYLTQIRVRKAKQLLGQGLSVADVAIAVGMSDQSHLTRHFKSILGVTPGHYQNMSISFKTPSPQFSDT